MKTLSHDQFSNIYLGAVDEAMRYWNNGMQQELSRHCAAWAPGRFDFNQYLRLSLSRYYPAYLALVQHGVSSVCDMGGFWGVFPTTLARLGFTAAMTEASAYYSGAFSPLFDHIRNQGVEIIDFDPFASESPQLAPGYDAVLSMAVLEHYPHSHKTIMRNISHFMKNDGIAYIEVPNIAYWPNRVALLFGHSPLVPIESKYESAVPFIGHHHEFTLRQLTTLATLAGFNVVENRHYNYSNVRPNAIQRLIWCLRPNRWNNLLADFAFLAWPSSRECIAITCKKAGGAIPASEQGLQ